MKCASLGSQMTFFIGPFHFDRALVRSGTGVEQKEIKVDFKLLKIVQN